MYLYKVPRITSRYFVLYTKYSYGHGAMVAYGSPKPLIWVRILVPVQLKFWIPFYNQTAINMIKITNYFKESYKELMEKVTWPTWAQLQQSTMIVIVATIFITAIIWVMDLLINGGLKFIYNIF